MAPVMMATASCMLWVFGLITPALPPRRWDVNAVGDIEDVGHVVTDQDDAQVTRPPEQGPGAVFGAEPDGCLLVDRLLPSYDHAVVHARLTRTPPATCYQAAGHLNLLDSAVIRFLLGVRSLPQRIADRGVRRGRAVAPATPTFRLDDLPGYGWALLGERAGREVVFGQVGRPWKPVGASAGPTITPRPFRASTGRDSPKSRSA